MLYAEEYMAGYIGLKTSSSMKIPDERNPRLCPWWTEVERAYSGDGKVFKVLNTNEWRKGKSTMLSYQEASLNFLFAVLPW